MVGMKKYQFKWGTFLLALVILSACGTLEKKAILINVGDDKSSVLKIMGIPDDRQINGQQEAWQYCQTGAGFGYHDYRIIWFDAGLVAGITSYKDKTAGTSCTGQLKTINWEDAPDTVVEIRNR